jgi:uncharacterized protein (UPF0332 family)
VSLHDDLLEQARHLCSKEPRRPKQASLRRAVSSAYYALFHKLVFEATHRFIRLADRAELRQCLGRAFGHADMKDVSVQFAKGTVSPKLSAGLKGRQVQPELRRIAVAFVDLQQARHEADYDSARLFRRREVVSLIDEAEQSFADWQAVRESPQADTYLLALLAQRQMRL